MPRGPGASEGGGDGEVMCGADGGAGEFAMGGVDGGEEFRMFAAGVREAFLGEEHGPAVGDIAERLGGGPGIGAGHVGDAVVEDILLEVGGVFVSGGSAGLGAAALVDGDVHEHAAGLHLLEHVTSDEFGCGGSGDEDGADDEIHPGQLLGDVGLGGVEGVGALHGDIEEAHSLEVHFENGDIGTDSGGDPGCVDAGAATSDDHDATRGDTGDSAEECATAAAMFGEMVGTDDGGHTTGDFAHRLKEGETLVHLKCFIGEGRAAGSHERFGEGFGGGEVEVGEENVFRSESGNFLRLGFLHFDDELGLSEDSFGTWKNFGSCSFVEGIGIACSVAGAGLHDDLVSTSNQFGGGRGDDTDAMFLNLDFLGDSDDHIWDIA